VNLFRRPALAVAMCALAFAHTAHAADNSAGSSSLKQARSAWERGSLDAAEPLYRDALEKGGLSPSEVLEGYVRLGSIRASHGKKESALAAFRAASVLDANFTVPSEAGRKGAAIAEKARKDTAKIGSIRLGVQLPQDVSAGKPFRVTATLDRSHLRMVNKVTLVAKDGTTAKEIALDALPDESVEFEVGPEITLPGASITVRVDALDGHKNRLATAEDRVRIPEKEGPPAVASTASSGAAAKNTEPKKETSAALRADFGGPPNADTGGHGHGSFWSSPWPYIIGGIALAGAGAAFYFGTRPADTITTGPVVTK
jgi:hypothetical protein